MIRDPKGNELRLVLLQVIDRDAKGPLTLRVRHDEEKLALADDPNPTFFMVWAATTSGLPETSLSDVVAELADVKEKQTIVENERVLLARDVARVTRDLTAIEAECREKTEALRVLNKERDPDHVDRVAKERVDRATANLEAELRESFAREEALKSANVELAASKRKLREALDRAKGKR